MAISSGQVKGWFDDVYSLYRVKVEQVGWERNTGRGWGRSFIWEDVAGWWRAWIWSVDLVGGGCMGEGRESVARKGVPFSRYRQGYYVCT